MLSKMRGKMGGMVFRVDPDAGQVVSEYNAHPKNPRTILQTNQRSKMNLAGQISALTPYGAIAGLSTRRRMARSMFVSNILRNAGVTANAGTGYPSKANILFESIVFSRGRRIEATATVAATYATGDVVVTVKPNAGVEGILGMRMIIYGYKDGVYVVCDVKDVTTANPNGEYIATFNPLGPSVEGGVNAVYVPIVETDGSVSVVYGRGVAQMLSSGDQAMSSEVSVSLAALGGFGASAFAGHASLEDE